MNRPAELRPNPDALLRTADRAHRGVLRIFLGAAPGVGKTYAMLQSARELQREGTDVVIGVVACHGRRETEALCAGLERLGPARIPYRDRVFEEFDVDAALKRTPSIVLVDELAHRNIPGSRHPRRYQDILELLDHGIEVWTAVNIQHLESLNDVVARITGIRMRETVPDSVLEQAGDVILIDLPPDRLIERLRQGKVYVPEQAQAALERYFSPPNLNALRELAVQAMADRIDLDVRTAMESRGLLGPWPVRSRILAAIDGSGNAEAVVRAARRLAERRHTPWLAVHVETANESDRARVEVERALALAERLGGDTMTLRGYDVVGELVHYAEKENITTLIMGRGSRSSYRNPFGALAAAKLMRRTGEFELTLVPLHARGQRRHWNRSPTPLRHYALAVASVAASVGAGFGLERLLPLANLSLVFMLAVLLVAIRGGTWAALLTAILSFLAFNFFFTVPVFSFAMTDVGQLLTAVFLLAMALLGGQLAGRMRHQVVALRTATDQAQRLLALSKTLAATSTLADVRRSGVQTTAALLGVPVALLASDEDHDRLSLVARSSQPVEFGPQQWAAAQWARQHGQSSGYQTDTLSDQEWRFVPLGQGDTMEGVLAVKLATLPVPPTALMQAHIEALANQFTQALTRTRLSADLSEARVAEETERLRSALLSSISHDLRTPLASMIGSASTLRELDEQLSQSDRRELMDSLLSEGERLNRYIQNLLDMTRLGYGTLKLERDWVALGDIVTAAVRRTRPLLGGFRVVRDIDPDIPLLYVHPALIEQALVNILENAAKFSPRSGKITIRGRRRGDDLELVLLDQGPGIPEEQRRRVFDMFFTGGDGDRGPYGSGLGLAICRGMIGAHGGRIAAESGPGDRGTAIVIGLPLLNPPGSHDQDRAES